MVRDIQASTQFYRDVFNVEPFLDTPRMSGFAFAQTTLLLFQLGATAADTHLPGPDGRGTIPGHGPTQEILDLLRPPQSEKAGSARLNHHFCLAVPSAEDVCAWEEWFVDKKVKVLGTVDWPRGGRSVYVADLDGNVGEVGSRGIWEHY